MRAAAGCRIDDTRGAWGVLDHMTIAAPSRPPKNYKLFSPGCWRTACDILPCRLRARSKLLPSGSSDFKGPATSRKNRAPLIVIEQDRYGGVMVLVRQVDTNVVGAKGRRRVVAGVGKFVVLPSVRFCTVVTIVSGLIDGSLHVHQPSSKGVTFLGPTSTLRHRSSPRHPLFSCPLSSLAPRILRQIKPHQTLYDASPLRSSVGR